MEKKASTTTEYYSCDDIAEKYISNRDAGFTELERRVVEQYFTGAESSVLDIGCGTGRTTTVFDQKGYDVIGVDLTRTLVERARSTFPNIDFLAGDACSLPFDDETFEYALFSYNGIDDIAPEEKRYEALREVRRVLKPGGVFSFSTHNLWSTYVPRSLDLEGGRKYLEFWIKNVREQRLFTRYKSDNTARGGPQIRYYIRPADQKQQLRNCGFQVLDVVRPDGPLERYFHHPYYVAQKRDRNR